MRFAHGCDHRGKIVTMEQRDRHEPRREGPLAMETGMGNAYALPFVLLIVVSLTQSLTT